MAQADRVRSANVTKILILTLLATVIGNYRLISRASVVVIVWYNTNKMFLTENTGLIESPIIILFLQYSHKRSSHVPEM
jgi:hypothetical protein